MSLIQASNKGALERKPIGSFGSSSVAAPKACSDNHLAFKIVDESENITANKPQMGELFLNF